MERCLQNINKQLVALIKYILISPATANNNTSRVSLYIENPVTVSTLVKQINALVKQKLSLVKSHKVFTYAATYL